MKKVIVVLSTILIGISVGADIAASAQYESLAGTYWKAVAYGAEEIDIDDYTAEIFLWGNGAGYFRFSQASSESNFYGFRDALSCYWYLEGGKFRLNGAESRPNLTYTGTFDEGRLSISYDGFLGGETFTIVMERQDMPSCDEWIGEYSFDEFAPPNQNMDYKITITKHPEWSFLSAQIEIDGFQTMERKNALVVGNAEHIELVFDSYGEDDMDLAFPGNRYLKGEIVATLYRKSGDIFTAWGRLEPMLPENMVRGVYFVKEKN